MELFSFSKTGIEDLDVFLENMVRPTKFLGVKHFDIPFEEVLKGKGVTFSFKKRDWAPDCYTPSYGIPDRVDSAWLAKSLIDKTVYNVFVYKSEDEDAQRIKITAVEAVDDDRRVYFFQRLIPEEKFRLVRMLLTLHSLAKDPDEEINSLYDAFIAYETRQLAELRRKNGLAQLVYAMLAARTEAGTVENEEGGV